MAKSPKLELQVSAALWRWYRDCSEHEGVDTDHDVQYCPARPTLAGWIACRDTLQCSLGLVAGGSLSPDSLRLFAE